MSELDEITMALTPLVKRDHPRWTANKCSMAARVLAKKFLSEPRKRMDWSRVEQVNEPCAITSKRLQVS